MKDEGATEKPISCDEVTELSKNKNILKIYLTKQKTYNIKVI